MTINQIVLVIKAEIDKTNKEIPILQNWEDREVYGGYVDGLEFTLELLNKNIQDKKH